MTTTPQTVEECLDEARKLIAEAVPEQDEMRRMACWRWPITGSRCTLREKRTPS